MKRVFCVTNYLWSKGEGMRRNEEEGGYIIVRKTDKCYNFNIVNLNDGDKI